jgi:hypothetical protein
VGGETSKVPEAQGDFINENVFASGMKTDPPLTPIYAVYLISMSRAMGLSARIVLSF